MHLRIERVSVPDNQVYVGTFDRGDDGVAVGERQRHRLLENYVLAVFGGENSVRPMELMRRRDIDDFNIGIIAQTGDVVVDLPAKSRANAARGTGWGSAAARNT